jgi:hypothetical protein
MPVQHGSPVVGGMTTWPQLLQQQQQQHELQRRIEHLEVSSMPMPAQHNCCLHLCSFAVAHTIWSSDWTHKQLYSIISLAQILHGTGVSCSQCTPHMSFPTTLCRTTVFLCIPALLQAVAVAAVSELNVLQQAADFMRAGPAMTPASSQPIQGQLLPLQPPLQQPQAAAAVASNAGLPIVLAANCLPGSWEGSCSSIGNCTSYATAGNSNGQLHCVLNPAGGYSGSLAALPLVTGQQQQQPQLVLLPNAMMNAPAGFCNSGSCDLAGNSWPPGLVTAVVASPPAAGAAAAAAGVQLSAVNGMSMQAAVSAPQVLLAPQSVLAQPQACWQQFI